MRTPRNPERPTGRAVVAATLVITLSTITGTVAYGQAPGWDVSPASFESTMSVTAAVFDEGIQFSSETDVVAAFVDEEVRGVATAQRVGGETLFLLTVYSDRPGDTVTFRVYDSGTDQVLLVSEEVTFLPDAVIGDAIGPLVLNVLGGPGLNRPAWSVEASSFGSTMSVVAELFRNGTSTGGADFLLAAFSGSEIRGVASPVLVSGRWLFFLTAYGEVDGESLSLQAYDAALDAVVTVEEGVVFHADDVVGSTSLPVTLHSAAAPGDNRPAWTVNPSAFESTMSVTAALYTDGLRSGRSEDLVAAFDGSEVRGVASPTRVADGMVYFITIHGGSGDGALTFRSYDSGADEVRPLAEVLNFVPDAVHGTPTTPFILSTPPEGGAGDNDPQWSVDAAHFGSSMNIIGSLTLDGMAVRDAGSRVAAFVGEEIRGAAVPLDVGGRSLFFLTVYANGVGEEISFRAYDAAADRLRGVGPALTFEPDAVHGSTSSPYTWSTMPGLMQPVWIPDTTAYTLTMTLVARLVINEEVSTHPDNIVAAFVDLELRGSANAEIADGKAIFPITVYANSDGETVRLEAYDAAADVVRPVRETFIFAAGGTIGTAADPIDLTTAADPPQAAPRLLSPTNGQTNVPLDAPFVWDRVFRASYYELEVSTSSDFADAVALSGLTSTSAELPEPLGVATLYYWRSRGVNSGGPGPWSDAWSFATRPSSVAGVDAGADVPNRFALAQSHPNPFNPTTQIGYELPSPAHVRLVVHDLLGRMVKTLVDEYQVAGRHSSRFDGDGLSSGLYVYRIEAGSFTASRTMTLLR